MRSSAFGAVALALSIAAAGQGCGCGASPVVATPPLVASAAPSASASSAEAEAPAKSFDPSQARALLADPRLAEVSNALENDDAEAAAHALDRAMLATPPSADERPRWLYQLGKLHTRAHQDAEAKSAYLASAQTPWSLAPYATCAAAEAAVRGGQHEEAIRLVSSVPKDLPISPACSLFAAEAHEARGEIAEASTIWRAYLERERRLPKWGEVSLKAAKALLATDPAAALRLARNVAIELPAGPLGSRAAELEDSAKAALPPGNPLLRRTSAEEMTRATALFDAGKISEAEQVAQEIEASLKPEERTSDVGCRAATLAARARGKRKDKAGAADLFGVAIDRCQGEGLANALFQGGVASDKAGRPAEAMARYERVERDAKSSRFADDARVKGAIAALALGDEARFSSMLSRIADDYPEGDSVGDGLFRLALHRIEKSDWAGAVAPLEASLQARPREKEYWAAGRARYFHARALLATGDRPRAMDEFAQVIADHPLTYYMALAHARLAELDESRAARALADASSKEAGEPRTIADQPIFHEDGFTRAIELLAQGDTELARSELTALGLTGPNATPASEWVVAQLYGTSGAFALAHSLPRGKLSDWLDHYPVGPWRAAWEVAYPRPFVQIVSTQSKASGIPASLAYAIMREESAFDPQVISGAHAHGLMQLILPTGKLVGKKLGLAVTDKTIRSPAVNIALGCRFLGDLRTSFPSCPAMAIPAYNAGPGAPKKWLAERPYEDLDIFVERIPYEETRNYTKRVLKSYLAYLYLYESANLSEVLRLPLHAKPLPVVPGPEAPAMIGPETLTEDDP